MSKHHHVKTNLDTFCKQRWLHNEFYKGVRVSSTMTIEPVETFFDSSINDNESDTVGLNSKQFQVPLWV